MNGYEYVVGAALFAALMFLMAWRERAHQNPRDAWLLAGFGTVSGAAAAALAAWA